jgi:hypothetical protein
MMKSAKNTGKNIGLYLSAKVYERIARDAGARGVTVTAWVRNAVIAACPPEARAERGGAKRLRRQRRPASKVMQLASSKPPEDAAAQSGAGKQEPPSLAALAERHRDRVLDLDARGHLPNAICAITRLEYRVVAAILATGAMRKEMRP